MATFVFGLVLLAGGGALFYFDRRRGRDDQWTDAEVVELQPVRHPASRGQWVYYPVVRFRTADGREVVTKLRTGSVSPRVGPGNRVRVAYRTGTGTEVTAAPVRGGRMLTGGLLAVIGLVLVALGIGQMIPHQANAPTGGAAMLFLFGLAFMAVGWYGVY